MPAAVMDVMIVTHVVPLASASTCQCRGRFCAELGRCITWTASTAADLPIEHPTRFELKLLGVEALYIRE
jgi:hypothetical protein